MPGQALHIGMRYAPLYSCDTRRFAYLCGRRSNEGVVSTSFSIYFSPIFIYLLFPLSLRCFYMRFFSSPFVAYQPKPLDSVCLFSLLSADRNRTDGVRTEAVYYKLSETFVRSIFILTQISESHVRAQQIHSRANTNRALQRCRRWSFFLLFFPLDGSLFWMSLPVCFNFIYVFF